MNKREVIAKVALESGIDELTCIKVIDTLEEVISQEISNSNGWSKVFEKVYSIMTGIHNKKQNQTETEK